MRRNLNIDFHPPCLMTLDKFPEELIALICEQEPDIIPNVRLACRRLHHASLFTFLSSFFEVIPVLAHADSIEVLKEIAHEPRFRNAVKHISIETHGAFTGAYDVSHLDLLSHGIIRDPLANALELLQNCKNFRAARRDCDGRSYNDNNVLGRSKIDPDFMARREVLETAGDKGYLLSDMGCNYASYILCDMLEVAARTENTLRVLVVQDAFFAFCVWADHLRRAGPVHGESSLLGLAMCVDGHRADWLVEERFGPTGRLQLDLGQHDRPDMYMQLLMDRFPNIMSLKFSTTLDHAQALLPVNLPSQLRYLEYSEEYQDEGYRSLSKLDRLIRNLGRLHHLEKLRLTDVCFESKNQCRALLRAAAKIPTLRELYFEPWVAENPDVELSSHLILCFEPCNVDGGNHKFFTTKPQRDATLWADTIHERTCNDNGKFEWLGLSMCRVDFIADVPLY